MIQGVHAMFYSEKADELRAFFKDKLQLPCTDVGHGWLIFDFPSGDLGVHPTGYEGAPPNNTHDISFFTDDLEGTIAELKERGVEFEGEIADQGFGLVSFIKAPGDLRIQLYQPKYEK